MSDQQERKGTKFVFATVGARTERGGCVTSGSEVRIGGLPLACVGDFIDYADGTRARIITGIGMPGNPDMVYAVVGSLLDNGDVINDSPHRDVRTSTIFVPVNEHGVELTRQ